MVIMIVLCGSVCCAAALPFLLHYKSSRPFTLNSFLGAFVYLVLWAPISVAHFLSYEPFHIFLPRWVVEVRNRQLTDLIAAASALVTIIIRLSYKPMWRTIVMHRRPVESNRSMNLMTGNERSEVESEA